MGLTPCFGFGGCNEHGGCARYHAIETSDSKMRWLHCPIDEGGARTLFVPMFVLRRYPDVERRAANAAADLPFDRRQQPAMEAA